jgi:Reverse transcriptase (RNA-dependent DNA polymerase)
VYKKGDKLDCTNYRGICLLNVGYIVFAKVLHDRLLPYADAVVQHYQAEQLFVLRQILEKGNEYNIQTHHLFIDFKAAYDTIIRNEVYVSMSELSFPTKLICLTAATLNTVLCCEKIQNDFSEYFETWQGLRQGNVLSPLIFNVVLESIVRRAKLQTNGTIFSMQKQNLVTPMISTLSVEAKQPGSVFGAGKRSEQRRIVAGNERTIRDVGQSVAFGDKTFEVVKEFVYLGPLMTPTNDVSLEIDASSDCASNCSRGICHVQQNSSSKKP